MKKFFSRIYNNKITIIILLICIMFFGIMLNKIIEENYNKETQYVYNTLTYGARKNTNFGERTEGFSKVYCN